MPAWLSPMRLIFNSIFEGVGRSGWHVQARLVLRLVTIAAFDCEDALPVGATSQAEEGVRATIIALQRCITCWVTIDAAWMHEDSVRFQKNGARLGVILHFNRLCPNIDKGDADTDRKQECRSKQAVEPKRTIDSRCHVHMPRQSLTWTTLRS